MGSQMSSNNASNKENGKKRCVVIMYDTLCRHFMPSYGNEWIKAPNFERLAKKPLNFRISMWARCPACQLEGKCTQEDTTSCTGPGARWALRRFDARNFRPKWRASHKVTDHHHYWEDGGATYHQRYTTFDLVRGQEGDKWVGDVEKLRDPAYGSDRWPEHQRLPFQARQH